MSDTVKDTTMQIRINSKDKQQVTEILKELGTTPSDVVTMLFKQIIIRKGIPYEITLTAKKVEKPSAKEEKKEPTAELPPEDFGSLLD